MLLGLQRTQLSPVLANESLWTRGPHRFVAAVLGTQNGGSVGKLCLVPTAQGGVGKSVSLVRSQHGPAAQNLSDGHIGLGVRREASLADGVFVHRIGRCSAYGSITKHKLFPLWRHCPGLFPSMTPGGTSVHHWNVTLPNGCRLCCGTNVNTVD